MRADKHILPAKIETFPLHMESASDDQVVIPSVRATWKLKYGEHAYYVLDFGAGHETCFSVTHGDIIGPGLGAFRQAAAIASGPLSRLRCLSRHYHYGFNFLEQIMLMTVPHTATAIDKGRFVVSLWSYPGYLLIDTHAGRVTYHTIECGNCPPYVLGSRQWFDPQANALYAMSFSLEDSLARIPDPSHAVHAKVFKHEVGSDRSETIWSGELADYLHDIVISPDRRYCVACELGMYVDNRNEIIPSKVLVIDLHTSKTWTIDRFIVAAHAQFDPREPDVIYFSNHNFQFLPSNIVTLLKKASYTVDFRGPASAFKYRLTPDGPKEEGIFTHPDFYRLTNLHVFEHRGRRIMAAMGFPDEVFLIDAETMTFMKKIHVREPAKARHRPAGARAMIGTVSPSLDGEKLYVQTTRSFQILDMESGEAEFVRPCRAHHSCSNHMLTCGTAKWN